MRIEMFSDGSIEGTKLNINGEPVGCLQSFTIEVTGDKLKMMSLSLTRVLTISEAKNPEKDYITK
jgi:hypothetical protein